AQVSRLVQEGKYHLAVTRLATDSDRHESLTREQRRKLDELRGNSELQLRLAIHRTYRFLYYPSGDVPARSAGLAREVLSAQEQGDVKKDQSHVLLEALRRLDKAHTADDAPVAPEYLKHVAWTMGRPSVTPGDLRRAYARRRALRILFNPEPLKKGIREGITRGHWVYYDPAEGVGYGASSPPPLVRLDDDADLMEPEEAARRSIPIKGETVLPERCPVCGNPAPECVCAREEPEEEEVLLQAEGNVDQALQRLVDKMHDAGIPALRTLQISVSGDGREGAQELQSIGLAVPQMGPGGFNLDVKAAADFGTKEDLRLEFRGPWERYRRLKDVTDPLFRQAGRFHVNASLTIGFAEGEGSPDRLNSIREVLRTLNLGHIKAKAEPEDRP
ncbi:MAG: hypothetical protein IBX71_08845, partial [Candidatus Desulforudis sp.]|nr:hypothetical protein [Desulforudis sp.]